MQAERDFSAEAAIDCFVLWANTLHREGGSNTQVGRGPLEIVSAGQWMHLLVGDSRQHGQVAVRCWTGLD